MADTPGRRRRSGLSADTTGAVVDAATVAGYRIGALAARLAPAPVAALAASTMGFGASLASADKRAMIQRHLRRAAPHLGAAVLRERTQEAFDSYARYYVESFRLPTLSATAVDRGLTREGYQYVLDGLAEGKGVILALPHLGGWEWAGRWMTDQGHRLTVVVEPLQPPELFEWFTRLRRDLGMTVVPLGPQAAATISAALRENQVVCLLCDRDLERTGVEVEFFGERTTLPAGPALLGLRTGAPILPTAVYFTARRFGHHAIVKPPVVAERTAGSLRADVARVTQALAHDLEDLIRRAPEQWHLFQPNWPSDPGY